MIIKNRSFAVNPEIQVRQRPKDCLQLICLLQQIGLGTLLLGHVAHDAMRLTEVADTVTGNPPFETDTDNRAVLTAHVEFDIMNFSRPQKLGELSAETVHGLRAQKLAEPAPDHILACVAQIV